MSPSGFLSAARGRGVNLNRQRVDAYWDDGGVLARHHSSGHKTCPRCGGLRLNARTHKRDEPFEFVASGQIRSGFGIAVLAAHSKPRSNAPIVDRCRLSARSRPTVMLMEPLGVNLREGVEGIPRWA